jgi:UPF0176 protein
VSDTKNMGSKFVVCALYRFVHIDEPEAMREPLLELMRELRIKGTLLLATEGINGTVAGDRTAIDALLASLTDDPRFTDLTHKESCTDEMPFLRAKVKLKKEIVTLGVAGIDPENAAGTYVQPKDWNALIADPDVTLIDTRNDYEVEVGTFTNAINPKTQSFREFPRYVAEHLDPARHKKIAMFCTGGIRCEKSTAYLKAKGFAQVYHLRGGILKYLEDVPAEETQWQGECFVFDERVTVDQQLQKGRYAQCNACRMPISEDDLKSEHYIKGVSCPHCFDKTTEARRNRFAERQKQVELARQRGETHIGEDVIGFRQSRRTDKLEKKNRQRQ